MKESNINYHTEYSVNQVPISITLGEVILEFRVFSYWSINKVKCLVVN